MIVYQNILVYILKCIFVSDLHGKISKFEKLFTIIENEKPDAIFFGGDILPKQLSTKIVDFLDINLFSKIKSIKLKSDKEIRFFIILGNDDPRSFEKYFIKANEEKIIDYICEKTVVFDDFFITGYPYVPPTPFQLKDWEKYDVSRFVDVGSVSPEEGIRSFEINLDLIRYSTMSEDLKNLSRNIISDKAIYLFHSPPYKTKLDRAELDGKMFDHAPIDVHIGSIAIKRFIEKNQPFLALHGHVHESTRLTGYWKEKIGKTYCFSAAHDGSELVLIKFDTNNLDKSEREVISVN